MDNEDFDGASYSSALANTIIIIIISYSGHMQLVSSQVYNNHDPIDWQKTNMMQVI